MLGDVPRKTNPTFYRIPSDYANLLESAWEPMHSSILELTEDGYGYTVVAVGSVRTYIKVSVLYEYVNDSDIL